MKKDDTVYLQHVLDAIKTIEEYLQGVTEDQYKTTRLLQDEVIRQIEMIGEAVRHVSRDIRKTYPEVPWPDVAGMRDKLIHDYFGVDIEKVWDTTQDDLPVLKPSNRDSEKFWFGIRYNSGEGELLMQIPILKSDYRLPTKRTAEWMPNFGRETSPVEAV